MTKSPSNPRPVKVGRYRYSKLRWRLLVHALDAVGTVVMALVRLVRPAPVVGEVKRILVVQLDHLGDAVLSTPLFGELVAAYPDAQIDVLASPSNHEVFEADPRIGQVLVAQQTWFERRRERFSLIRAVWRLGRSLRPRRYDLGVDVRGDVLSVMVLVLAGIPRRLGWDMGGGAFLLTDVASWRPGRHEVRSRLALVGELGIEPSATPRLEVHVDDQVRVQVARRLAEAWPRRSARRVEARAVGRSQRWASRALAPRPTPPPRNDADWLHADRFSAQPPLAAVHMGAGTAAKRWPLESWRTLIARFLDQGWRIVLVGGADDVALARLIPSHSRLVDWSGRLTVVETTALLERADLFVGADSGPAHLAASAGTLSVVLFSGTNQSRQWRPWSRHTLVVRKRVPCQPCHQKTCPLAGHPCMSQLDPERVFNGAMRLWARSHQAQSPHDPL